MICAITDIIQGRPCDLKHNECSSAVIMAINVFCSATNMAFRFDLSLFAVHVPLMERAELLILPHISPMPPLV